MAKTKQQPVHEIRLGAIKAAIWENQTTTGTRHNLQLLAKVVDLAHTWIFQQTAV